MSTRKVKRTWWNKKKQQYVTKVYEYEEVKVNGKKTTRSRAKSLLIVGKNGVYEDRLKELLSSTDSIAVREEIKAKVKAAQRKKEKLSIKTLLSKIAESKIEKAFINAGYTEDEILDTLGVPREDLFDESNWEGSVFKYKGKTYDFVFKYTGSVLVEQQ